MKAALRVMGLILSGVLVCSVLSPAPCFGEEYEMSSDPRLAEPKESYETGQMYMERGYKEFRRRPGQAQKMFEHAEDYFLKASFLYRELGQQHGIDVSNEINTCEDLYRRVHVQVGKSRRKRKRAGAAY